MRGVVCVCVIALATIVAGHPAAAQTEEERAVAIDFDIGDFDSAAQDWPVAVVNVSGDMTEGEPFTVELRDGGGAVLWAATQPFEPPTTSIPVGAFVAVGDVMEAAVSQASTVVAGEVVDREAELFQQGNGGGGTGQLALSMVVAVILVAILFRSPIPSATTQRWRK